MLRRRRRRLRVLPVNSLIPNILTVLALCAGMTAIRFALEGRFELAAAAIIAAGILDGLDGRMARLLKGATRFGAELDSLSDFIAFGVAPATIVYLWSTHALGGVGWIAALALGTCCALRLARFNTALDDPTRPVWSNRFFTGVAAPAGAGFAILPMILSFQVGDSLLEVVRSPYLNAVWQVVVAYLMISRIPTFSFKVLRVKREHVLPTLVLVGIVAAVAINYPWFLMSVIGIAYLASMPFSYRQQRRLELREPVPAAPPEPADGTEERTDSPH